MTNALIYLIVMVAVAAVVFLLAALVFGRGEELAPLPPGASPTRLPSDAITADDVRELKFQQVFRGYSQMAAIRDATVAATQRFDAVLSPVSKSFGNWSSGAGGSRSATIRVTNSSGASATYTVAVDDGSADGATFSGGGTFTLAPGESRVVTVTLAVVKRAAEGHKWATLRISSGGA